MTRQESQPTEEGKVLVLGADTRSFLSVVRSLGRRKLSVHVAWHSLDSPAARSRYIRKSHTLPKPWESPQEWKQPFREMLESERFDLVIPCNDPSLIPLQRNRQELEAICPLALIDDAAHTVSNDKQASTGLAESLGIPVPRSYLVSDTSEAECARIEFGLPVVLKPLRSYHADRLAKRNQVIRVDTEAHWMRHVLPMLEKGPIQIQEFFDGVGVGIEFLADRGRILVAFQHIRLHEPESGGGSSHRMSAPIDPQLGEAASKLVAELEYSGVGMIEFRQNPRTGLWKFIEINSRFWGSLPLAVASGADFPAYLFDYLVHGRRKFPQGYRSKLRCRNFEKDVSWYRDRLRQIPRRPSSVFELARDVFGDLLASLLLRQRSDTLVLDDPKPGIAEFGSLVRTVLFRGTRKLANAIRKTPPVRYWQRRRAVRRFQRARRILIVCKGNICRSPFAERYLRDKLPATVEVSSCGYYPTTGRPSPENASAAARNFDIGLTNHRSQVIDEDDVNRSDLIFVFDEENRHELRQRFRSARNRIFLIGSLNPNGPLYINDPYGEPVDQFHRTYLAIKQALDTLPTTTPEMTGLIANSERL